MNKIKSGIKFNLSDENPVGSNVASFSALASELELSIPDYQRPYVWEIKQTRMLLKDIENTKDGALLGSIILHEIKRDDKTIYEVIDGQQRLTTIKLILMASLNNHNNLKELLEKYNNYLKDVSFFHKISQDNIKTNYEYIKNYLSNEDKAKDFLENLEKTQFIIVATTKADDAFIFFDNTNSKGKKLENYDLIKAFHLQAMQERHKDLQNANAKYFESVNKSKEVNISNFIDKLLSYARYAIKHGELDRNTKIDVFDEFCKEDLSGLSLYDTGIIRDFSNGVDFFEYIKKYYEIVKTIHYSPIYIRIKENNDYSKYLRQGLRATMIIFMDKHSNGNFDLFIRLLMRLFHNFRITNQKFDKVNSLNLAQDIIKKIYFSTFESQVIDYLKDKVILSSQIELANIDYTNIAYRILKNDMEFFNNEYEKYQIPIISQEVYNKIELKFTKG